MPRLRHLPLLLAAASVLSPRAEATSLVGREFRLGWPHTPDITAEDAAYDLDAELVVVAADRPVSVHVTAPGVDRTVSAAPGAPASVRLPRGTVMTSQAGAPQARGIHVEPSSPTSCGLFGVLLRVPGSGASVGDDVARVLPVDVLGQRTLGASYWGQSELLVVATQNATQVSIASAPDATCPVPAPVTLNAGETYLFECVNDAVDGSVAGALVTATKPVAVMSGSASSSIVNHPGDRPGSRGYWGWDDVLLESPWPVDLLGREHAHAPFRKGSATAAGDLVRIIAACDDTDVRVSEDAGTRSWHLAQGEHADVESPDLFNRTWRLVPGAARISSNRGVLVQACTVGGMNAGIGDPSLSLLDPQERWERDAIAWLPSGYEHSLSIVTDAAATTGVTLDGAAIAGTWTPVPDTTLAWVRLDLVASGEHRVSGSQPLFVQCSGFTPGSAGAYSYPAIPWKRDASGAIGGIRVSGADACATSCPGTCTTLRAPSGFASYAWTTGASGEQDTECPDATTTVGVTATDANGCRYEGTATLFVIDAPTAPSIDGPDSACAGACVDLSAPAGYDSYAWSTGATTRAITACPTTDTTYTVTVTGPGGCGGDASKLVRVHQPPVAGDAQVTHPDPCLRGLELNWLEAEWRPGSPGGTYNVYRREGGCVATSDPSWTLVAVGLSAPPWRDLGTLTGVTYAYMIEAEDAPEAAPCDPGPDHGGSTGRRCARPSSGLADPGDPDAGRLVSFSPHLRAQGYTRQFPGGPADTATFHWPTLPPLDPATHVEAWRSADPRNLVRVETNVATSSWTDSYARDAPLLFYKMFDVTSCGLRGQ